MKKMKKNGIKICAIMAVAIFALLMLVPLTEQASAEASVVKRVITPSGREVIVYLYEDGSWDMYTYVWVGPGLYDYICIAEYHVRY
jgi:hypothetical protein